MDSTDIMKRTLEKKYKSQCNNIRFEHFLKALESDNFFDEDALYNFKSEPLLNKKSGKKYNKKEVFRRSFYYANKVEWPPVPHNVIAKKIINELIADHPEWEIIKQSADEKSSISAPPANDPLDDIEFHKDEWENNSPTEQQAIIKSRIGQGIFRERLIALWGGCSVTGITNLSLLRASHIKPWRDCSNEERLDPYNGLLLHPALDLLFDSGYVTFFDNGDILISKEMSKLELNVLNISSKMYLRKSFEETLKYLKYHRKIIFKKG